MQITRAAVLRSVNLLAALAGLLMAQTAGPSITLTSPSVTASETDQSSIDLEGSARSASGLSNVLWVNQLGKRGAGEWTPAGGQTANWTVQAIPLRLGINQITVTIVDSNNHSASVRVVVNRVSPPGTQPPQPLPVRTGIWQNRPIVYQLWNGMAVVEGDIILAPETSLQSGQAGPAVAKQGIVSNGLAINYTSQFWPAVNGVHQVPYVISGSSSNLTTAIDNFNAQFSGLIQFVSRTNQANYVNITVEGNGSGEGYSNVGMIGGPQTLDCGGGCVVATWLHEMGHTVGLLHEHQRPDRGSFITLNLANADLPNVPGNFTLFTYDYQTLGLYDYASVMHYGAFDFTNAGLPVIESIPPGIPLGASSSQTEYSTGDIDQIERLYGATPSAVTVTTNPPGLQIVVDGVTYTAPHTFSWALNSTHTLNLPADPQTTNPSDGSTYVFGVWNDLGARSHTITVQPGNGALASPANKPAITVYEANFIRLQPFAFLSPSVYPSGAGRLSVSPNPTSEYGGSFYTDRTLVTLTLTPTQGSGYNFYGWSDLPYPPSDNPHSFYDQSPITAAQAVFVSTSVTIVGESLTGPNTWNPGLSALVDGNFTYLPTAFSSYYNGFAWNSGSTHSISVNQQQSPVTTNVFYNWNSWSDAGAITHNIMQPSTGSQTISASFTPFYAFYTIPAALGSSNASCYGGVTTSPAGTPYPANTIFDFYEDGASVTATATANSQYPGIVFAGWAGSLSGNTNPQTTAIHAQFVPTANFNTVATPITITGFNPASVAATSSAMNITINGTGFTVNSYVYWNGSYRASTYVSSTQLTMHLNAGDLANPGGQDVFVGNYVTNSSNSTCWVGAESTFTVTNVVTGIPSVVSATPNPATGLSNTFALAYSDTGGPADLKYVAVLFNSTVKGPNACYADYYPATNALYLWNDAGTVLSGPITPGSGTLSNSQCTITGSGTSVVRSGDTLTLNLAVTASSTDTGKKTIYMEAVDNSSASTGWIAKGAWAPAANQPPTVVSVSPNSASGLSNTFALVYSDPNGNTDLDYVAVLFNSTVKGSNACYADYYPATNGLYLWNDAGTVVSGPITPGSGTLSNGQCMIGGSGTSVTRSGDTLTLNLDVTASSTDTGKKTIYMEAVDNSSASTGWIAKGAWAPAANQPPTVVSVSPNSASGLSNTFALVYSDPNGNTDLDYVAVLFNSTVKGSNACYADYYPATNGLYLWNDAGTVVSGPITPGSGTLSNSQCTLTGSGTSVVRSGDTLTLNLDVTASSTDTGKKTIYMEAVDNSSASTGWIAKGAWMPAANQPPTVVSVSPNSASGLSNTFALVYSDPNGNTDLDYVAVLFNSTVKGSNACYADYYPATNGLYLWNDAGTVVSGPITPGSGTLSNGQCTIGGSGTSVTRSGDTLTLNLAVTASSTDTGKKTIYMEAVDNSSASTGWVNEGAWTP